jgi:hypothetical protein
MELMDIVVILLIGVGIGFGILCLYIWVLYQRIRGRVDDMVNQIINEAEANLVGLDIEVENGVYFCYNNEDKQFVCQGNTVAEIREGFRQRYPTKTAYLAGGDPELIERFKAELLQAKAKEHSENSVGV